MYPTRHSSSLVLFLSIFYSAHLFTLAQGWAGETPLLESIENTPTVKLKKGRESREVKAGEPIHTGEKVISGEAIAKIRYPDGSLVTLSPQSEFIVEAKTETTQWNKLTRGSVRGEITKAPSQATGTMPPTNANTAASNRPKFIIRTKAAILGVRGTDFIMALNSLGGTAEVHTLEGSVEVAKSESALLTGQGTVVNEGQFVQSVKSGLSAPEPFNKDLFLESFKKGTLSPSSSATGGLTSASTAGASGAIPSVAEAIPGETITLPSTVSSAATRGAPSFPLSLGSAATGPAPTVPVQPEIQKTIQKKEPASFKPLSVQAGIFFTQLPNASFIRAASFAWTPSLQIPMLSFLALRGHAGVIFGQQGDLSQSFFITELQVYLTATLLDLVFMEGGIGQQSWKSPPHFDALLKSINAGIKLKLGMLDSVFVGVHFLGTNPLLTEYRAGIGITF